MSEVIPAPDALAASVATAAASPAVVAPAVVPSVKKPLTDQRTREHMKTPEQRAEDIAYTLNHALSCLTTDVVIVPTIAAGFNPSRVSYLKQATEYMGGEIVGDLGAVPITVAIQRLFPGFMDLVGQLVDPLAKPMFRHGARTAAERWGKKHGYEATSAEVVDRAQHMYTHEMQHLPQALMWNVISFPLSVASQLAMGAESNWKEISRAKLLGTAISNVLLIGGRALIPDKAEKFDRWDSKHIIRPATRTLSGLFGVDSATVDRMDQKADAIERAEHHMKHEQRERASWRNRVLQQDTVNDAVGAQPSI